MKGEARAGSMSRPWADPRAGDDTMKDDGRAGTGAATGVSAVLVSLAGWSLIAVLVASWNDLLPGSWFLQGLVEPHAERRARQRALHTVERVHEFVRENAQVPEDAIVFFGSSTIERFPLERLFPGKPCINRGIADASDATLARVLDDCLPRARLGGLVLYAGSVDFREAERAADPAGCVDSGLHEAIDRAAFGVPQVWIGILPEREMSPARVAALAELNAANASLADQRSHPIRGVPARPTAFVRVDRPPITTAGGTSRAGSLAEEFSADGLHLDEGGYRHLAAWIETEGGEVGRLLAP